MRYLGPAGARLGCVLAAYVCVTSCTPDFGIFAPGDDGGGGGPDAEAGVALDGAADSGATDADAADSGATDAAEAGPIDGGDISAGLVAYYMFDETSGTTCSDSSGNNHTATLMGGATFAPGQGSNAVTLSGAGQYVSLPPGIVSGLSSFSICAWVKLNTNATWSRIFDFGTGTTAYMMLTPNSQSATTRFAITVGGNTAEQRLDSAALSTNAWQHVAVTLSQGTALLYVNGNQVAQNTNMTLTPSSLGTTTRNWLGRSQFVADPYLNGQIDNFRIYDRALSAAEIQLLVTQSL